MKDIMHMRERKMTYDGFKSTKFSKKEIAMFAEKKKLHGKAFKRLLEIIDRKDHNNV